MEKNLLRTPIGRTSECMTADDFSFGIAEFRARKDDFGIFYGEKTGDPQSNQLAGWLRSIEDAPDSSGVLWGIAEFTDEARQSIKAGKYTHLVPIWEWSYTDSSNRQGLSLVGLVLGPDPLQDRPYGHAADTELPPITLAAASNVFEGGRKGGVGGDRGSEMQQESVLNDHRRLEAFLDGVIKDRMKERGITYRQAMSEVVGLVPQLWRLREALRQKEDEAAHNVKCFTWAGEQLRLIDNKIEELTKAAIQAHPELNYCQAMKAALSEHPGLFRRREELFRQTY